ncbi:S9 family peptidase [Microlunatus sp. Y2014]|uniref:S9 family peptidase n=1 Tax=Microlunatus sp. Y2014 TaxID=3418488 RepID=UPI003DA6EB4A
MSEQPHTGPARTEPTQPPTAPRRPTTRVHHDDEFHDPYEWLRNADDPEVIAHLEAENAWTEQQSATQQALRDEVFESITARTKQTDMSVPVHTVHGDPDAGGSAWWYYSRAVEGQEYAIHCRVPATDPTTPPDPDGGLADEVVLLDGNAAAEGHEFFSVGAFDVSPDGNLLAYSVDHTGAERYLLRVVDLRTGELLSDSIDNTSYSVVWAGNEHLFYTRADDAWRPYTVLRHRLGTAADDDVAVFTEPDERFWVGAGLSRDEEWVLIGSGSKLSSEWRILPAADPYATPRVVAPRRDDVEYDVEPAGDRLLIVHNLDATDFMVSEAPLEATGPEQWRPVVPHTPGVRITDVDAYRDHVVVSMRRDGLTAVHVMGRDAHGDLVPGHDVDFDAPLYTASMMGSPNWVTDRVRLNYTSMVTPNSTYDLDLTSRELTLLKQQPVLDHPVHGPYRSDDYAQTRTWATADDGTRIPISLVHRADLVLDGSAPLVLYGYGSYEIPVDPRFSIPTLPYLDRGFVYAIAHVRGGGELGRSWYEQGRLDHKRNTFTDFIACADHLIAQGWTSPDRLGASGGSAGGLLVGAVANLAGDRFRAILAAVPFVDPLTTILDPELPLTVTEWEEWGNPLADPAVYAYMKSYSPYENVEPKPYPAILATTSLNDTRVSYTEPAKWVAELRHTAEPHPDRPVLLKTEMVAGHGGVSGRYRVWADMAFETAWLIDQLDPTPPS